MILLEFVIVNLDTINLLIFMSSLIIENEIYELLLVFGDLLLSFFYMLFIIYKGNAGMYLYLFISVFI
jgi:hypothetical protein